MIQIPMHPEQRSETTVSGFAVIILYTDIIIMESYFQDKGMQKHTGKRGKNGSSGCQEMQKASEKQHKKAERICEFLPLFAA